MIQFATSLVGMAEIIAAESKSETRRSIKKGLKGPAKHKVPKFFTIVKMRFPVKNKETGAKAKFGKVVYYLMADGMIRPLPPKPMYGQRSESPGAETMMEAMGKTIRYVRPDKAEEMMHKHNGGESGALGEHESPVKLATKEEIQQMRNITRKTPEQIREKKAAEAKERNDKIQQMRNITRKTPEQIREKKAAEAKKRNDEIAEKRAVSRKWAE